MSWLPQGISQKTSKKLELKNKQLEEVDLSKIHFVPQGSSDWASNYEGSSNQKLLAQTHFESGSGSHCPFQHCSKRGGSLNSNASSGELYLKDFGVISGNSLKLGFSHAKKVCELPNVL